jgi:hypothetical protein
MGIFVVWFILCLVFSYIGEGRKIGALWAFFLCLFLSPVIGGIIVLASKHKADQIDMPEPDDRPTLAMKLAELLELREAGAIDEDEYLATRKKILGI